MYTMEYPTTNVHITWDILYHGISHGPAVSTGHGIFYIMKCTISDYLHGMLVINTTKI
jgi:hypothetical protein